MPKKSWAAAVRHILLRVGCAKGGCRPPAVGKTAYRAGGSWQMRLEWWTYAA